jgi:hypothetical protein
MQGARHRPARDIIFAAFGNSGGDREMLEWTCTGSGRRLMMLVLHDDANREYACSPAKVLPETEVITFTRRCTKSRRSRAGQSSA